MQHLQKLTRAKSVYAKAYASGIMSFYNNAFRDLLQLLTDFNTDVYDSRKDCRDGCNELFKTTMCCDLEESGREIVTAHQTLPLEFFLGQQYELF